mgnify:CR=1 FL=1
MVFSQKSVAWNKNSSILNDDDALQEFKGPQEPRIPLLLPKNIVEGLVEEGRALTRASMKQAVKDQMAEEQTRLFPQRFQAANPAGVAESTTGIDEEQLMRNYMQNHKNGPYRAKSRAQSRAQSRRQKSRTKKPVLRRSGTKSTRNLRATAKQRKNS